MIIKTVGEFLGKFFNDVSFIRRFLHFGEFNKISSQEVDSNFIENFIIKNSFVKVSTSFDKALLIIIFHSVKVCEIAETVKKTLTSFMESGNLCDFVFEVEGKNYKAHKVIIACKYFEQWFHFEFFFFFTVLIL